MISYTTQSKIRAKLLVLKPGIIIKTAFFDQLNAAVVQVVVDAVQALPPTDGVKQYLRSLAGSASSFVPKTDNTELLCILRIKEKVRELAGEDVIIKKTFLMSVANYVVNLLRLSTEACGDGTVLREICFATIEKADSPQLLVTPNQAGMRRKGPAVRAKEQKNIIVDQPAVVPTEEPFLPSDITGKRHHLIVDFSVRLQGHGETLDGRRHFYTAMTPEIMKQSVRKQLVQSLTTCGLLFGEDEAVEIVGFQVKDMKNV